MKPRKIEVIQGSLVINWDDGNKSSIKLADLRRICPCAECAAEKEEQSSSYIPIFSDEQITLKKIELVGRYAVSLEWADGHNTGVYEFSQLSAYK